MDIVILATAAMAAMTAIELVINLFTFMSRRFGEADYTVDAEFSPTAYDLELVRRSGEIFDELFPQGIAGLQDCDTEQQIHKMVALTEQVADCYGVALDHVCFLSTAQLRERGYPPTTCGYFDDRTQSVFLNIDLLASNDRRMHRELVNTVFHECRHAYQYRVAVKGRFRRGEVDARTLRAWRWNFANYTTASVDFESYVGQPLEFDARNFAWRVMEVVDVG